MPANSPVVDLTSGAKRAAACAGSWTTETIGVLRSIYAALPAGVMLWRSTEAFSPLDRARVGRALEAIPA